VSAALVDSDVLIDVMTQDADWYEWSANALATTALESRLTINPIIYGEASVHFSRIEALEAALPRDLFDREDIPYSAAFMAGKSFIAYRRRGGLKRSPLPDFFIGAHAAVRGYRLLTRDASRYRSYFPRLEIIAPAG
jgi:predicted nucleic acid-binding protein